jgi:hypothetical protein
VADGTRRSEAPERRSAEGRGVVAQADWLWALLVSSVVLTAIGAAEVAVTLGPAAVVLLAQPLAFVLVAGLVMVALSSLSPVGVRRRRDTWRIAEPSWPAWTAAWSVGRAPVIGAVHGRDGPGSRARRP